MVKTFKIWPQFFIALEKGLKTKELRLADFKVRAGFLELKEWFPKFFDHTKGSYTGRVLLKRIVSATFVDEDELSLEDKAFVNKVYSEKDRKKYGFVIMELK